MSEIEDKLNNFYFEHKDKLAELYPGIKISYFVEKMNFAVNLSSRHPSLNDLEPLLADCLEGRPLEYMAKEKFFYRSNFFVDERVLIPRSETEILVEDVIQFIQNGSVRSLAEIGVGSGAIAISIAKECSNLRIWAGDISAPALEVARHNISNNEVNFAPQTSIDLVQSDRLEQLNEQVDCIVSNPPYIKQTDTVHSKVREFEPGQALFLNDHEYHDWFDQLFKQVHLCLNEKGKFFMEGHEDHLESLKELAGGLFSNVELKKDYTDRLRFLIATK